MEFVIVGGLAAVLNVAKLLRVLNTLDGYRMQPERRLKPGASHLSSPGHRSLITNCGPLDVLGTIGHGSGYADLLPHTIEMETGGARVLNLATTVRLKEELAGFADTTPYAGREAAGRR